LAESYTPRPYLLDKPIQAPDLTLFIDGSSSVNNGEQQAGATVVTFAQILWAEPLPPNISAQLAELIALTKVLQLSKGKRVNIYIDSKYAFLILHAHANIWRKRGMLTAFGLPSNILR
jgi:ribonuclease HI